MIFNLHPHTHNTHRTLIQQQLTYSLPEKWDSTHISYIEVYPQGCRRLTTIPPPPNACMVSQDQNLNFLNFKSTRFVTEMFALYFRYYKYHVSFRIYYT